MDMSHYPANYPILKIQNKITEPLAIRVVYSRPSKNSRVVFGELVEYGKVWRLGANEATEIEFFRDVRIGNTKVKKGRYSLYAIPETDRWTMILNKETDTWGAFQYDAKKDVLRTDIPVKKLEEEVETFTLYFEKNNNSIQMIMAWDKFKASLPITLL
jgi:Protein of unknown function (DUF2911)